MKKTVTLSSDVYERLCRARNSIDVCYDLPLNLDEISSKACFSRYHFLRLFRRTFAKTPHQYLIERRIEKAKELLRGAQLSVTDVCFEVGFQSLGSFSSLFIRQSDTRQSHIASSLAKLRSRVATCPAASW